MLNIATYRIPTHEIETNIKWLEATKEDCDRRITELRRLQSNRKSTERHRDKINEIALTLYNESMHAFDIDNYHAHIEYIQLRFNCSERYAKGIYDPLKKWAKRKRIEDRNKQIVLLVATGMNKTAIAEKYCISRQQVYNCIKNNKDNFYLKKR